MELFKLFGKIVVDNAEANRAIDETTSNAEQSESRLGSTFKKIGAAVAGAFAIDKIKDFGQAIVEMSAGVSAEESAFAQIMGDFSDEAQEKMGEVAEATGVVDTRLTEHMTSMTAKFKGLGYGVNEATDFAQRGLTLASDAAAFWDKSLDDSMSHLNSFINGSYEGGEAIGLFANDTQMAAYAIEKGLVSEAKEWSALEESIKQATRLEYAEKMMEQSGAVGQAAKESGEYANVQANLTEKWRQYQAQIGEPVLQNIVIPVMEKLGDFITKKLVPGFEKLRDKFPEIKEKCSGLKIVFEKFGEFAKDAFEVIGEGAEKAGEILLDFIEWITGGSEEAELFRDVILGVATGLLTYEAAMLAVNTATKIGKGLVDAYRTAQMLLNTTNPFGWAVIAISAIVGLNTALQKISDNSVDLSEEFAKISEEEQALIDRTNAVKESYDNWAESKKSALEDVDSEFDYYRELSDELDGMVDKNGKIKEGYEERAAVIAGTLSDAFGIEIEILDGTIQKYDELQQSIEETLILQEAQAALEANMTYVNEAKAALQDADQAMIDNQIKLQETTDELAKSQAQYSALMVMSAEDIRMVYGESATYDEIATDLEEKIEGLTQTQKRQDETLKISEEKYVEYVAAIENNSALSRAVVEGDSEAIGQALDDLYNDFITCETGTAHTLQKQVDEAQKAYDNILYAVESGNRHVTQEEVDAAKKRLDRAIEENEKFAKTSGQGGVAAVERFAEGVNNTAPAAESAASNVVNKTESGLKKVIDKAKSIGANMVSGFLNSVNDAASGKTVDMSTLVKAGKFSVNTSSGSSSGGKLKTEKEFATGGIVTRETIATIGEDGPEAVVPLKNNTEWIDLVAGKVVSAMGMTPSDSEVVSKLNELIDAIKSQKIYLDSGALVGELAGGMDSALGNIERMKRRGLK